jgi:signal transduction histidine kinase
MSGQPTGCNRTARLAGQIAIGLVVYLASISGLAAEPRTRSVLVFDPSAAGGPFYPAIYAAIKSTIHATSVGPVSISLETLDLARFPGAAYEDSLRSHHKVKYRDKPIDLIIALGSSPLEYVLRSRAELWPGVPVVFGMVDEPTLARLTIPPDVTGRGLKMRLQDSVSTARSVVPDLKRIAIVGDALDTQPVFAHFKQELPSAADNLEVIDLTGLPMSELRRRVAVLPGHTAIIYTSIYTDGSGTSYPPAEALALFADAANSPIVVSAETFVGRGGIGGFVMTPDSIGKGAGQLASRLLGGERLSDISLAEEDVRPIFDWRQLQRWGVQASQLPPGSEIRFRPLTAWDQYRWHIVFVAAVILFQTVLIAGLLYERGRRRTAETNARDRLSELAHLNRQATGGEMSASIAHELNQPLAAILSNTEAAQSILQARSPDLEEIKQILADIRRDDQRATEVIRKLRRLFKKTAFEVQQIDLNGVLEDAIEFLSLEASEREVTLIAVRASQPVYVNADPTQLQQVIMNLGMNAIEASTGTANGQRKVIAMVAVLDDNTVELSVSDSGPGVPEEQLKGIFAPFFTTKKNGMGMGLSIARTITEAHGGRIWAENGTAGGAVFHVTLPCAPMHGASERKLELAAFKSEKQIDAARPRGPRQVDRPRPMNSPTTAYPV